MKRNSPTAGYGGVSAGLYDGKRGIVENVENFCVDKNILTVGTCPKKTILKDSFNWEGL